MARGPSIGHRIIHLVEYAAMRALAAVVARLPRRWVWRLGGLLGGTTHRLLSSRRRLARDNAARAFPELSSLQVDTLVRRSFENFGRTALDIMWSFRLARQDAARWVETGPDVASAVNHLAADGRGGIVVQAHLGNWEILGMAWGWLFDAPSGVIGKPLHNPYLDRWLTDYRQRSGNRVMSTTGSARQVMQHLREGRLVVIVMDQRTPERYGGVSAEFFGHPAMTTKAPAAFSLSLNVPIVILSCVADESGCYHVRASGTVQFAPSGDRPKDILELTRKLNALLEEQIRRAPEHYFWMHDRWGRKRG